MSYPIMQNIIPDLPRAPYRNGTYEGVVNHSTDTLEATDERETTYFDDNWKTREAFVHFFVDWDSITQIADTDYIAWGAGHEANQRYVHIELCETNDIDKFQESYKRYVWLTAYVLRQKNLGVTDGVTLLSHDWVSKNLGGTNHTDPIAYLASHGITWDQHVANVEAVYESFFQDSKVKAAQVQEKVMWDGMELKKGQIGRLTILKPINLWQRDGNKLEMVRVLNPGEVYRVYGYDDLHGGQYNVGGLYVTNIDGYVKYETPSKNLLEQVN